MKKDLIPKNTFEKMKHDWKLQVHQAQQSMANLYQDLPSISSEIYNLLETKFKSKYEYRLAKKFMEIVSYNDEDKLDHYRHAFVLRSSGFPILTDYRNKTYKIISNLDELDKVLIKERGRRNKKVARAYVYSVLDPNKMEEIIKKKMLGKV